MNAALLMTVALLSATPAQKDLDEACRVARAVTAEKPASYSAPGTRWWDARWSRWYMQVESSARDAEFKSRLTASGQVAPADKYGLFVGLARESGLANWRCPALEKVLTPADADLTALCAEARNGEPSSIAGFHFDSAAAEAAWTAAQKKTGAAGFAVLQKASEWPQQTWGDCDGVKRVLNALDAQHAGPATEPAAAPAEEPTVAGKGPSGVTVGAPMVMGQVEPGAIEKVFQRNLGQLRFCHQQALTKNPRVAGELTVKFVISATGAVMSASVSASTIADAELGNCVAARMRTWQFPRPRENGVAIVTAPLSFHP